MAANSMRTSLLVLLPILLMMQVVNGIVTVNNTSTSEVSVYDMNTTIIIDPLKPNEYTYFPLESAGPDLFQIEKYTSTGMVSAYNLTIKDGYTLLLYTKTRQLRYNLAPSTVGAAPSPSPSPSRSVSIVAAGAPSSKSAPAPVAGG